MAAIYDYQTADTLSDGLQGSKVCDEARRTAQKKAAELGKAVVLEDDDGCWLINTKGDVLPLSKDWAS